MCRNHNRTVIKVRFDFKNAFFQNLENVTKIRQNPYLFDNLKIRFLGTLGPLLVHF